MENNRDVEHPRPSAKASKWVMQNRQWLEQTHPGKWIAVGPDGLIAVGDSVIAVAAAARSKGNDDPLVTAVRRKDFQGVDLIRTGL